MMQQVWKTVCQEFSGGPVVETLGFHCQRSDSVPGMGANIYKPFGVIHKQKTE